ncbi:biotin-independent malonate decarboxylase subunit beta [Paenibacillus sp. 2KB_22]|uniref:biotin-independent malonate decarboxylase subunit beta n=1 Tax=Paenibacillus sp. 2KB_22 TaxID=3232978 RepID=UPI003F9DDC66
MFVNRQIRHSFIELSGRERAETLMDSGTFRELLGPFDKLESPHLAPQGIVPQSDDGVVIAQGTVSGHSIVVISIEGGFQGGGIGEVSGAKIAGALELALEDNQNGRKIIPIVILDTGGVRLQEANYGLLSISEISSAVVALRQYVPVLGIIPGNVGCFGGMSITAALFSHLIMTKQGRFGLNGPEVIEQEAGVEEFDSRDRQLIWGTIGGTQRFSTGLVDTIVNDDVQEILLAVKKAVFENKKETNRTEQVDLFQKLLKLVDPEQKTNPQLFQTLWGQTKQQQVKIPQVNKIANNVEDMPQSRGRIWFTALTGMDNPQTDLPSVLYGDVQLGKHLVRYISVVPNPHNRFPRVRNGEVGLEEGWEIAKRIRQVIEEDRGGNPRSIIAIVDVPSQAYGYREELFGIHYACAAAVDAYASARLAGHPVISLLVGKAISGAFLAHGYQASRILALNDPGVNVHAMSKQSATRITRRSIDELEKATEKIPAMAYDIQSYATLGAVHELIEGIEADLPKHQDIQTIREKLIQAMEDIQNTSTDLTNRLQTIAALNGGRQASIKVRKELKRQWT